MSKKEALSHDLFESQAVDLLVALKKDMDKDGKTPDKEALVLLLNAALTGRNSDQATHEALKSLDAKLKFIGDAVKQAQEDRERMDDFDKWKLEVTPVVKDAKAMMKSRKWTLAKLSQVAIIALFLLGPSVTLVMSYFNDTFYETEAMVKYMEKQEATDKEQTRLLNLLLVEVKTSNNVESIIKAITTANTE